MMMLVRLISTCFFLVTVVAVVINASELPRLRGAKPKDGSDTTDFVEGFIKAEIDVEKGLKCKEKIDSIKKKGVGKECEGGMKKTMSIGIRTNELVEDIATEMKELFQSMIPDEKNSLLPSDETMVELMNLEEEELLLLLTDEGKGEVYDPSSTTMTRTVSFGGYFKLFWGCNVTFTKEGRKMSKNIECGAKSLEGVGKKPGDKILYNEEEVEKRSRGE
jgi:hypothetical protein